MFTFLNALVEFATEGFAALINLSIGLFGLAILSWVDVAVRKAVNGGSRQRLHRRRMTRGAFLMTGAVAG